MKYRVKKQKAIISGILLVVILMSFIFIIKLQGNDVKTEMKLNFESRVDALNELDEFDINKYGWLQVQGTTVDIPILTIADPVNDYSHGWVSSNSIGMKTRNVLVGHNILNVSNKPMVNEEILTDFEDLMAFVYYNFAKENMYISFTKNGVDKTYVIYGIGFYDYDYDNAQGLNSEDEIKEYIKNVSENSIYKYDVDVNENDDLLTIKTCTRYFGSDEKQQFVIDAREVRNGETILKYNVKKTKLYKEYKLVDYYKKDNDI